MPSNISFRAHLLGSVTDFADSCDIKDLAKPPILVALIVSLSKYHEEGIKLSPEIYLCENIEKLLSRIPNNSFLKIGECLIAGDAAKEILKKCAPLAIGGWCIYIERSSTADSFSYGLFRGSLEPLSIPIHQVLFSDGLGDIKIIRIQQTADDCIEIINHKHRSHNIFLSNKKEDANPPKQFFDDLINTICEKVSEEIKDSVKTFLHKALHVALASCHGTLIVVCRSSKPPEWLSDGTVLTTCIDIADEVKKIKNTKGTDFSTLVSFGSILRGMISSDGIVVFSNDAKILAYNCFIKSSGKGTPYGGARRRAFDELCKKIRKGICAVFIQSQDGWTDFRR